MGVHDECALKLVSQITTGPSTCVCSNWRERSEELHFARTCDRACRIGTDVEHDLASSLAVFAGHGECEKSGDILSTFLRGARYKAAVGIEVDGSG